MTAHDEPRSGPTSGEEQAATSGRYVAYETDDGVLVIRDETDADAWIQSDTVVSLSPDE